MKTKAINENQSKKSIYETSKSDKKVPYIQISGNESALNSKGNIESENLELAIQESMKNKYATQNRLNENEVDNIRKGTDRFIGIQNIGNTCYFNALMQILYFSNCFSNKILAFKGSKMLVPEDVTLKESKIKSVFGVEKKKNKEQELRFQRKNEERLKIEYLNNGVDLILELQKMFGLMLKGKVNRANPQDVLDHLMQKDTNKKVEVGLQKDIVEFLGIFFECLEAGFTVDPLVKCFILYKLVYIKIYFLSL